MRNVIQLVPALAPAASGVGDYALNLARELRGSWRIDTSFLALDRAGCAEALDGFRVGVLERASADLLSHRLNESGRECATATVLLQLSPYGFDRAGIPTWLAEGLRRWKGSGRARRLVTYFHELYATSPPWRKAFWLSPHQRRCVRDIYRLSDAAATNTERYGEILSRWHGDGAPVAVIPVASNVGEPGDVRPLTARDPLMVLWGDEGTRDYAFGKRLGVMREAVDTLALERIVTVGDGRAHAAARVGRAQVSHRGTLPAAALTQLLSDATIGVFRYNPNFLGKSSLFAAFCAHGVAPLCLANRPLEARTFDGIQLDAQYMTRLPREPRAASRRIRDVAERAAKWYRAHSLRSHAEIMKGLIA